MPYAKLPAPVIEAWPELSPRAKNVVVAVASFMNRSGRSWPKVEDIMEVSGITRRQTVYKACEELTAKGLMKITKRHYHRSNIFEWLREGVTQSVTPGRPRGNTKCTEDVTQSVTHYKNSTNNKRAAASREDDWNRGLLAVE